MSFKNPFVIGLACVVVIACLLGFWAVHKTSSAAHATTAASASPAYLPPRPTQDVDGIDFEVSTTTAQQEQGLSGRAVVPDNYAMLFVFPQDGQYGFWMKDMLVPLDMIWLTDNGTIASITPDVPANSYPTVFYPPEPIRYVLETRVGLAAEKGWKAGTRIPLPLPYGE